MNKKIAERAINISELLIIYFGRRLGDAMRLDSTEVPCKMIRLDPIADVVAKQHCQEQAIRRIFEGIRGNWPASMKLFKHWPHGMSNNYQRR